MRILSLLRDADAGLLRLEVDNGAVLEMAPDAPEAEGLKTGDEVDPARFAGLEAASQRKAVARQALRLLARRLYTRQRLQQRLLEAGHSRAAIDAVMERLEAEGLVDDERFAQAWVSDQLRRRAAGRLLLRRKLADLGVPAEVAARTLDEALPADSELEAARRALQRRLGQLEDPKGRARALRFLISRGFSRGLASRVVQDAWHAQRRLSMEEGGGDEHLHDA